MRKKWTDKDIQALKRLYPQYLSGKITRDQIESLLQRDCKSISSKACQLKLTNHPVESVDWKAFEKKCKELGV